MTDVLVLYRNGVTTAMRLEARHLLAMQRAAGGHVYFYDGEEPALREQVDAEVLVFWGGTGRMPERWCASSRRLRWIHTLSAGYDPIRASGLCVVVKKSRHEKYLFLICFFKSRHEEHFCGSCFFKSGHGQ